MLGRFAAAFVAGTVAWFLAEWLAGMAWPDNDLNVFVVAWMASLVAGVGAGLAVGMRGKARRRKEGRW